ncbi:MAG: PhoH family protein [Rhodospirillales bacterium]|nr:PhoH family protein [Alphaproteobacteria bacterium]MCB9986592.1 PhoH family protein [Rhodospirillales bacterium]USO06878.1 MAG: PhoH family protein [Rhodospirillales bacterium]
MSRMSRKEKQAQFRSIKGGKPTGAPAFTDDVWDPLADDIDRNRDQSYVKRVRPRTEGQKILMDSILGHAMTLAIGPAGTGKTYLAISAAVEALEDGRIDRIILSRPAMEAGESIGFLPGDMHEKMAPYLRPLYDALGDRLGGKRVRQYMDDGTIEIAPIGFMRGRTLNNAFIVVDEAQNCTYQQLKMLLSRLGWNSTMVVTGDPEQSDLLPGMSGLAQVADKLARVGNVGVVTLKACDIVRHPLVAEMLGVL